MAELQDLDTSQIGFIAYWNAIDNGASSVDPTESLTADSIISYETYDNGIEGTARMAGSRQTFNWRIKTDGWYVVWRDRDLNLDDGNSSYGYLDIFKWNNDQAQSADSMWQYDMINQLWSEDPNASDATFSTADIGLYSYDYSSATTVYILRLYAQRSGYDTVGASGDVSYDDGSSFLHWEIGGNGTDGSGFNGRYSRSTFDGTTIHSNSFEMHDAVADGLGQSSGTIYNYSVEADDGWTTSTQFIVSSA